MQKSSLDDVETFDHPNIQPANIEQAEKMFQVLKQSFANNPEVNFSSFATYKQTFTNNCYHYYYWQEDESIIGILKLVTDENTEDVEINTIGVLQQFRRQHIGTIILNFALGEAKKMKKTKCRLSVAVKNQKALNLYRKAGFVATNRSQTFRWKNEKI